MAFKFSLISVMHLAIDVSHCDIFETADFSEGLQKRQFYKRCDLEIEKSLHFPAPDMTMSQSEIQVRKGNEVLQLEFVLANPHGVTHTYP